MSLLALSTSFEYLCYGSTTIMNILLFSVRGSTSESDGVDRLETSESDV